MVSHHLLISAWHRAQLKELINIYGYIILKTKHTYMK